MLESCQWQKIHSNVGGSEFQTLITRSIIIRPFHVAVASDLKVKIDLQNFEILEVRVGDVVDTV